MSQPLRLKLDKGRFIGHTVPLKVLARLQGLEEALQATARAQFFAENPERRRATRHFEDQFSLALDAVSEGSAILDIVAPPDAITAFGALASGLVVLRERGDDSALPRTAWRALAGFFQGLDPAETLELEGPGQAMAVPPSLRAAVAAAAKRRPQPREQAFWIAGQVVGVRIPPTKGAAETYEVELQVREGAQRRTLPVSAADVELCQRLFRDRSRLLRAVGSCRRGEEGELVEVLPGLALSEVGGPRLDVRFEQLREVGDGWWDGEGKAPSRDLLERVRRAAWALVEQGGMDRPHAYPTPEGGVQIAWNTHPGSIELEANPDGEGGLVWSGLGNGQEELVESHDFPSVLTWVRRAGGKVDA